MWATILCFSVLWGAATALSAETATLSSLAITGPASVNESSKAGYTATATFSDRTTRTVTTQVRWSENSSYATISSGGALTTSAVGSNQTVTITAQYSSNGVTRTATKSITIANVAPAATLSSIAIGGPSSVNESSSASYTATATFSNGTTQNVTTGTAWSENSSYSTISSAGVLTTSAVTANQAVTIGASYTSGGVTRTATKSVTIANVASAATLSSLAVSGPASVAGSSTASYAATATFSNGTTQNVTSTSTWSENSSYTTISTAGVLTTSAVTANQAVTVGASYTSGGVTKTASLAVTVTAAAPPPTGGAKSISSTSQNRATLPTAAVPEQTLTTLSGFQILSANDLGMHCGDLDHRVASILPPFNVLHTQVIQRGTSSLNPEILTPTDVDVLYSAASNPLDPALANPTGAPIFKTNFWDPNPANTSQVLGFSAYDPFYPSNTLSLFSLAKDSGLPAPDLAMLYPVSGTGQLVAAQQKMPGAAAPYTANTPQAFSRFDTDFPFFVNFPFGYRQSNMNWFAADGIPATPYDDFGRKNSFPLMRVQAKSKTTSLTGTAGTLLASVDSVTPVSAEADCFRCHTSSADGGGGNAACVPGVDANCTTQGSPRSNTAFLVVRAADDTSTAPADAKREWAADNNIIRLHDAKHGTHLQTSTPVVCQKCHYTPALDLAHVGPPRSRRRQCQWQGTEDPPVQFPRDAFVPRPVYGPVRKRPAPDHRCAPAGHHRKADGQRVRPGEAQPELLPVPSRAEHQVPARGHVQRRPRLPGLPRHHAAGRKRLLGELLFVDPVPRRSGPDEARALGQRPRVPVLPHG